MTLDELNIVRRELNAAAGDADELQRLAWRLVFALAEELLINDEP